LFDGSLNNAGNPIELALINNGTHGDLSGGWVTNRKVRRLVANKLQELIMLRFVNNRSSCGHANLTLVKKGTESHCTCRLRKVRSRQNYDGVLSTKL
jgi:hypothetical protein